MKDLLNSIYFKVYLVLLPLIMGTGYFITQRAHIRLTQLKQNDMDVDIAPANNNAWIYMIIIGVAFTMLYAIVVKDLSSTPTKEQD